MTDSESRRAGLATALFALVVAELTSVVIGWVVVGMTFTLARDTFMITNAVIGGCCAVCGVLIARHRTGNRLGWLLLGAGICQTGTAAVTPWLVHAIVTDAPFAVTRTWATLYNVWPASVALFVPLALLHFPDGRLPGFPWRAAALVILLNAPVQLVVFGSDGNPLGTAPELVVPDDGRITPWIGIPGITFGHPLWTVSDAVLSATFLAGLILLVVRYRRGDERTRQQLQWLILALAVALVIIVAERQVPGALEDRDFPVLVTAVVALVPIAMTIAVLRHGLLDIRLVWSRAVTYGLLTAAVVAAYLVMVNAGEALLRQQVGLGTSVLATLVVAAGFNPVRVRLQRRVDRMLYGERADPVRAAASVTAQLAAGAERPTDVLPALCHALRLPYAALADGSGGTVGEHGTPTGPVETVALRHAGERVGELRVGVRSGQRQLDAADRAVLELMAVPIGVALRAESLSAQVQRSRRSIVTAREEERRRLRRDLHDGLGPVLTGIAFQADAVVNLATDPHAVGELGGQIRDGATGAIADVRRLIYELRPTALDELGLVEALRRHAQQCSRRADGAAMAVTVIAPDLLPDLPAAVEVAAYRIVTEALTNVARHAQATAAEVAVELGADGALVLHVRDDGARTGGWTAGVGMESMRERAGELGGTLVAAPTPGGGRVAARLPLETPAAVPA